jgi:hypothetical protein
MGSIAPIPCPSGYYSDYPEASSCKAVPDYYTSTSDRTGYVPCPGNKMWVGGGAPGICITCPKGYSCSNNSPIPCPNGKYIRSPEDALYCGDECPPGYTTNSK